MVMHTLDLLNCLFIPRGWKTMETLNTQNGTKDGKKFQDATKKVASDLCSKGDKFQKL